MEMTLDDVTTIYNAYREAVLNARYYEATAPDRVDHRQMYEQARESLGGAVAELRVTHKLTARAAKAVDDARDAMLLKGDEDAAAANRDDALIARLQADIDRVMPSAYFWWPAD